MGDTENARRSYQEALVAAQRAVAESPQEATRHVLLALVAAGLGNADEALREGRRAIEILPESVDAFDGPILTISMARIHTLLGRTDEALSLLEHSLSTPAGVTVSELRFDPTWDALRDNPRFQKLLSQGATPAH
jgi:tetratricopeptide (TPR) repeat protein